MSRIAPTRIAPTWVLLMATRVGLVSTWSHRGATPWRSDQRGRDRVIRAALERSAEFRPPWHGVHTLPRRAGRRSQALSFAAPVAQGAAIRTALGFARLRESCPDPAGAVDRPPCSGERSAVSLRRSAFPARSSGVTWTGEMPGAGLRVRPAPVESGPALRVRTPGAEIPRVASVAGRRPPRPRSARGIRGFRARPAGENLAAALRRALDRTGVTDHAVAVGTGPTRSDPDDGHARRRTGKLEPGCPPGRRPD
ncbi:hypothetical protein FHS29_006839 [Saccharothrix tamanrassetensis]|uniref:Uncharacterized protein n=1 Tax=Saccharothrix tamanrassetensis TaxID=1051531 RepID=A0A841CXZ5_9PSEU|nr:hypothetical protein [Saccharothrix tamanrassetensis]